MHCSQPVITRNCLEALYASAVLWLAWLARVIVLLGAPRRSRRLARFVKRLEREVECVIYLMAVRRARPRLRRIAFPRGAPSGFRRVATNMRLVVKSARVRARGGSLRERALRLIEALAAPERYVARFLKRLRKGLCAARLIAAAPPAFACAAGAPVLPSLCDSS